MPATLKSRIPELIASAEVKVGAAVEKAVFDIEAHAKSNLVNQGAVDTGNLLGSIQGQMNAPHSGEVSTPVEYSVYVEFGTGARGEASSFPGKPEGITYTAGWPGMAARPYLTPAVEEAAPSFFAEVKEAYK